MKKLLLSFATLLGLQVPIWAQSIGVLPGLRTGKLTNGLTYYVYPTEYTPGEVHLYLFQNVGGVLETDKEQGMAHFMEHLSFNVSEHFPKGIMPYLLANSQLKFDAKTGINETNYQINHIPTSDKAKVDTAMLILRDWVEGIHITPEAVEKERGIVLEEWRQRAGVDRRLTDSIAPVIYNASPYSYRNTIGQEHTLKAFTVKGLKRFREKWYRPELQAVMVIGDINSEEYEQKLQQLFRAKPSKKLIQREDVIIAPNKAPLFYRFIDKDNVGTSLGIYQRIASPENDRERNYVAEHLYAQMFDNIVSRRLARLRNDGQEEFMAQTVSFSPLVRGYNQIAWDIVPYSGRGEQALKQALALREQLRRDGFSVEEFEFEQNRMLEDIKALLENKDLDIPDNLMGIFKAHYLYATPIKSLREGLTESYEALTEMDVEDVNQWLTSTLNDENLAFITYSNSFDQLDISLQTFERLLSEVKVEPLLRFAEVKPIERMVNFDIPQGKIIKEGLISELETKEWTLSNGAKMLYKYVPDLKGQFYFVASSLGGRSAVASEDLPAFVAMRQLIMRSGLGGYSRNDIHHWLQGKDIQLSLSIENYNEGIGGNAPSEQADNFFEYLYMVLMKQNFAEQDLEKYKDIQKYLYNTRMATLRGRADEEVKATLYPYSTLNPKEDVAFYNSILHQDVLRVYAERMLSAKDFTFCILGDLPEEKVRRLTERYIASLPSGQLLERETYKLLDFTAPDQIITKTIVDDFEGNIGEVELSFALEGKLSEREEMAIPILENLLQARLFEELREREQGVYSIGLQIRYEEQPRANTRMNIHFNTEASKVDRMKERTLELIQELAEGKIQELAFKQALMPYALSKEEEAQSPQDNPLMWLIYLNAYVETGRVPQMSKVQANSFDVSSLKKSELSTLMGKLMLGKKREIILKSAPSKTGYIH